MQLSVCARMQLKKKTTKNLLFHEMLLTQFLAQKQSESVASAVVQNLFSLLSSRVPPRLALTSFSSQGKQKPNLFHSSLIMEDGGWDTLHQLSGSKIVKIYKKRQQLKDSEMLHVFLLRTCGKYAVLPYTFASLSFTSIGGRDEGIFV